MRLEFKETPDGEFLYVYADPGDSEKTLDTARGLVHILSSLNASKSDYFHSENFLTN